MLHPLVGRLHHADLLVAPGVGADLRLVEGDHLGHGLEQGLGLRLVAGEVPELHRDGVAEAGLEARLQHLVRADVDGHGVGVGPLHPPVEGAPALAGVSHAQEDTVGGGRQAGADRHVLVHHRGLAEGMVDARPEQVAAHALHRRGDPGLAAVGLRPDEAVVPRRALGHVRLAGVGHLDPHLRAGGQRRGRGDAQPPVGIGEGSRRPVQLHRRDGELRVEVQQHERHGRLDPEGEDRVTLHPLARRVDAEAQVGVAEVQRRLLRRQDPAGVLRVLGHRPPVPRQLGWSFGGRVRRFRLGRPAGGQKRQRQGGGEQQARAEGRGQAKRPSI